jgi:predicted small integral membrane protein
MSEWLSGVGDGIAARLAWMAWTWPTALFFAFIALALATLTCLAVWRPETPRKGVLGFPTTRGDRFFVSLICAAFVHIFWMRFGGGALWYPLGASILLAVAIFRFA